MDEALYSILRVHNPWLENPESQQSILTDRLPERFIPRDEHLDFPRGKAELVVGPRQAGKTTWILHQLSQGTDPVLVLQADEPIIRQLCESPALAWDKLAGLTTPETILLIDEVQRVREAPLFVKGLVDLQPRRRIIVTGSSSFQFGAKNRESLAGRARRTRLYPFSHDEVAKTIAGDVPAMVREHSLGESWRKLVLFGGYPTAWLAKEPIPEIHHLVEAFVIKDVSDIHQIDNPAIFRKLISLGAADIGNLVNLSNWASAVSVSRGTVVRYLDMAVEAHLLSLVPAFVGGKRAEITSTPKVFFIDNGMRNALFGGFTALHNRADIGPLWENAIYGELVKRTRLLDEIYYWRTKNGAEVDFVIKRGESLVALEVKATNLSKPKLSRASRSFIEAYRPEAFAVINASFHGEIEIGKTPVLFLRPWELADLLVCLD